MYLPTILVFSSCHVLIKADPQYIYMGYLSDVVYAVAENTSTVEPRSVVFQGDGGKKRMLEND
jgi:hypothetical protein